MYNKIKYSCCLVVMLTFFVQNAGAAMDVNKNEGLEIKTIPVQAHKKAEVNDWSLQYKVEQQDVYIECIVPGFSLSKEEQKGHGYLLLKMNGEETARMGQAAFVMKNIPAGKHKIEIQPVSYDGKTKKDPASFEVEVPST